MVWTTEYDKEAEKVFCHRFFFACAHKTKIYMHNTHEKKKHFNFNRCFNCNRMNRFSLMPFELFAKGNFSLWLCVIQHSQHHLFFFFLCINVSPKRKSGFYTQTQPVHICVVHLYVYVHIDGYNASPVTLMLPTQAFCPFQGRANLSLSQCDSGTR